MSSLGSQKVLLGWQLGEPEAGFRTSAKSCHSGRRVGAEKWRRNNCCTHLIQEFARRLFRGRALLLQRPAGAHSGLSL